MNVLHQRFFFFLFSYISIQFSFKHKNLRQTTRKLLAYTKNVRHVLFAKKKLYFSIFYTHAHTQRKSEEEKGTKKKTFKILKNTICYFVLINILKHFIIFFSRHSFVFLYFILLYIHLYTYISCSSSCSSIMSNFI